MEELLKINQNITVIDSPYFRQRYSKISKNYFMPKSFRLGLVLDIFS